MDVDIFVTGKFSVEINVATKEVVVMFVALTSPEYKLAADAFKADMLPTLTSEAANLDVVAFVIIAFVVNNVEIVASGEEIDDVVIDVAARLLMVPFVNLRSVPVILATVSFVTTKLSEDTRLDRIFVDVIFVAIKSLAFKEPIVLVIALKFELEISLLKIDAIDALEPDIFVNIKLLIVEFDRLAFVDVKFVITVFVIVEFVIIPFVDTRFDTEPLMIFPFVTIISVKLLFVANRLLTVILFPL